MGQVGNMNAGLLLILILVAHVGVGYGQPLPIPKESYGAILTLDKRTVLGTAFIAGESRRIITCEHIFTHETGFEFIYRRADGTEQKATLIGIMPRFDIAQLAVTNDLPALIHGDFKRIRPGDEIRYIGWDMRLQSFTNKAATVTAVGTVLNQAMDYFSGERLADFLEFQGDGIPGYSGGPVFNAKGEVIALMREAWSKRGIKGGPTNLINRAFSIEPILIGDDHFRVNVNPAPK